MNNKRNIILLFLIILAIFGFFVFINNRTINSIKIDNSEDTLFKEISSEDFEIYTIELSNLEKKLNQNSTNIPHNIKIIEDFSVDLLPADWDWNLSSDYEGYNSIRINTNEEPYSLENFKQVSIDGKMWVASKDFNEKPFYNINEDFRRFYQVLFYINGFDYKTILKNGYEITSGGPADGVTGGSNNILIIKDNKVRIVNFASHTKYTENKKAESLEDYFQYPATITLSFFVSDWIDLDEILNFAE